MIYLFLWTVLIYGFFGWCGEVAFAAFKQGKFVNRGFLNGPICPIYGFGVLIVTTALDPIKDNIFLLFIGSVLFTSLLEFLTGLILEKLFHEKWWDYSEIRFNIKGYVCLRFSLLWGVAASAVVMLVHPSIMWLVSKIPFVLGLILLSLLCAAFAADLVLTLIGILKFPKRMRAIIEVEAALKKVSDDIGENVADTVFKAEEKSQIVAEKGNELKESLDELTAGINETVADKKRRLDELKQKYAALLRHNAQHKRIITAFPNLQNGKYKDIIAKIKENVQK